MVEAVKAEDLIVGRPEGHPIYEPTKEVVEYLLEGPFEVKKVEIGRVDVFTHGHTSVTFHFYVANRDVTYQHTMFVHHEEPYFLYGGALHVAHILETGVVWEIHKRRKDAHGS